LLAEDRAGAIPPFGAGEAGYFGEDMMKKPPYYSKMCNGNPCIVLQDGVNYDNFPGIAERWVKTLGLVASKKINGPGERIWECSRDGCSFWLGYEDWFPEIFLEPQNAEAAARIDEIGREIGADIGTEQSAAGN
jgi:hypothetical protein